MADETKILKVEIDASSVEEATVTIGKLTDANKKLREERKNVDLSTDEGRKRIEQINNAIDKNNELIKQNSSSLEKQRLNVGNYTQSIQAAIPGLDKLTGGAASAAQGIVSITKASIAFIATPIGAVITALGVALGALTAYFKGSEEGQDALAKAMAVGKVIFDQLIQVVELLGKALYKVVEFIGSGVKAVLDLIPGVGAALDEAIAAGQKAADLQDKYDADENAFIVRRAQVAAQVAALREQALKQEGAQRKATIEQAIKLEKDLAQAETEHAKDKLAAFKANAEYEGELTEEQKKEQAELEAAIINAESAGAQATIKFQKEVERLNDQQQKLIEKLLEQRKIEAQAESDRLVAEEMRKAQQMKDDAAETQKIQQDLIKEVDKANKKVDIEAKANEEMVHLGDEQIAAENALFEKSYELDRKKEESKKKQVQTEKLLDQQRLANASLVIGQAASLLEKNSIAYKVLSISQASIDTYRAANLALATYPPPFGEIAAATAIGVGLANVAKIAGFSEGGYTGDGGKYQPAGIVHAGEFVIPKETVSAYGINYFSKYLPGGMPGYADGGYVRNVATAQVEQTNGILSAIKNMPAPVVVYKEFREFSNRVTYKEQITSK